MSRSDNDLPNLGGPVREGGYVDRRRQEAAERGDVSQLGRADVWIYTDEHIVPAQLKINPADVPAYGWKDVPLWIVGGRVPEHLRDGRRQRLNRWPRIVVELDGEFRRETFVSVVEAVDTVLGWIRAGRRTSPKAPNEAVELWRILSRLVDEPVSAAVAALHDQFDRDARDALNNIVVPVSSEEITVPVLDVPELTAAFTQEARDSGLLVLHRQFWVPGSAA